MKRREFCLGMATLAGLAGSVASRPALAQALPEGTVSLVVPYPAGGPSDTLARIFNRPLGEQLKQSVIIENLGGVAGALAAQKVLSGPADGRMVFLGSPNEVILAPLANAAVKLKAEDFRLVHPIIDATMVLVARGDFKPDTVDELIEAARTGALSYGSVGVGSLYHLILEEVQQRTATSFQHVPYKGNAPLLQDLGGGQVDFALLVYNGNMQALVDQGKLKLIAQMGESRAATLQKLPTVAESKVLKGMTYRQWAGLMLPARTPEPIVEQLHQALLRVLADDAIKAPLAVQSMIPPAAMSLDEAARFFADETARYRSVAGELGLKPQ